MDDDKLIKKISLDFFDMLYEDLTREQQSVVRKAVEEDKRRTSGVIKRPSAYAGGGMMDINTMTAPLGYAAGGPAPKESGGLQPPTGFSKWYADKFPVDPIHQMKENLIDTGKRTVKGIGKGIGKGLSELFGAKPAEAGTFTEDLEMEIIKLQSEIQSLQLDNLLMGTDNDKAITSKQNLLDYYMSLK